MVITMADRMDKGKLNVVQTGQGLYTSFGRTFKATTAIVRRVSNLRDWGLGRLTGFYNPDIKFNNYDFCLLGMYTLQKKGQQDNDCFTTIGFIWWNTQKGSSLQCYFIFIQLFKGFAAVPVE